ncbi:GntR family transcriptional regulator [Vacuolonema iberomarrocanum]|uniref:GntR family transcriptional regulator n=1 Tax=Vacuolonema iberomarrocanum TaxID=3454632 RepID=UPI003F6DEF54
MVFSLQPIARSQSLYQQAYQALYTAILSGDMAPGERLIETQLASRFAVSRTPIREAIRQLQLKGLVMQDESGGLCVTKISVQDALHLYDCRIALEQLAVRNACHHAPPAMVEQMEQTLQAMHDIIVTGQASEKSKTDNSSNLLDLNAQFHHLIATSSGNPWLAPLLEHVSDKLMLLRVRTLRSAEDLANIHSEHRKIFEAIAKRNEAMAAAAVTEHLVTSKERIVRCFENGGTTT